MLKHLWTAFASAGSCLWARLAPDVVDEGVPVPKRPVMVMVEMERLDWLRSTLEAADAKLIQSADDLEAERTRAANAERLAAKVEDDLRNERLADKATAEQNRALLRTLKSQGAELAALREGMNSIAAIAKAHEGRHAGIVPEISVVDTTNRREPS